VRDPGKAPPKIVKPIGTGEVVQVRAYRLLTPLFGGGVDPGMSDPVTVVRPTEVRGQLRFWWRACRAGAYGAHGLARMRADEALLWGAASTQKEPRPSKVHVRVTNIDPGTARRPAFRAGEALTYGAFPLTDKPSAMLRYGVTFELEIRYPARRSEEVEAALWAWETLGGIGARTRRGFGALALDRVVRREPPSAPAHGTAPASAERATAWLQQALTEHVVAGDGPAGVPRLQQQMTMRFTEPMNGEESWLGLLRQLKDFRQQRAHGARGPYGESMWPEPNAVRRRAAPKAPRLGHARNVDKFPRAAFGLPIIFHFKDVPPDPKDTTLKGGGSDPAERLASRLILRPVACDRGRAVGLALILDAPATPPGGLALHVGPRALPVDMSITPTELPDVPPLGGEPDVLLAFLNTL